MNGGSTWSGFLFVSGSLFSLSLSSFCSSMEEYPSRDEAAKEVLGFLIADRLP